jgi:hypothetical protein
MNSLKMMEEERGRLDGNASFRNKQGLCSVPTLWFPNMSSLADKGLNLFAEQQQVQQQ